MSRPLLLRVYGDSLSLPRISDDIAYDATWPELVRASAEPGSLHLYNHSRAGGNVRTLFDAYLGDAGYFGSAPLGVLVIQCGICDCAPRPVPAWLKRWISRLPQGPRHRVVRLIHVARPRIQRAGIKFRDVPPGRFRETYHRWLRNAAQSYAAVLTMGIAPTNPEVERHSPGLAASIENYNCLIRDAVLRTQCSNVCFIDVQRAIESTPDGVQKTINAADGHHLTRAGHALYGRLVVESLVGRGVGAAAFGHSSRPSA